VQGPTSCAVLREAGFAGVGELKPFQIRTWGGVTISRTGFTGDLGYEVWVKSADALALWDRLWDAGKRRGITAIGYQALNHARIETGFIVANSDFSAAYTVLREDRGRRPDEIGLGWLLDFRKGNFNGRRALLADKPRHCLVGLEIEGNVPADGAVVYHSGRKSAGIITAACWSPTGKRNIALASLDLPYGDTITTGLEVEIYALRELRYYKAMKKARVVPRPFVVLPRRTLTPPADF
jgi:aminomethyltransferase